jgi:folate receptor
MSSCNDVSEKCQKFFIEEMCFYECDKSMGKFRKHDDCAETASKTNNQAPHHLPANAWQISAMPVSATYCDAWYDACKDDDFCAGPSKSYFEMPQCLKANKENNNTAGCKRFSDVYANGKEVCEVMWDRSFKYETDESKAYVMSFPEGSPNPNNEIFIDRPYPAACSKHNVNVTHPHVDVITGERISAEAAGCAADWHRRDGSGYVMAGTAKTKTAGASPRSAAAAMIAAVLMLCLA